MPTPAPDHASSYCYPFFYSDSRAPHSQSSRILVHDSKRGDCASSGRSRRHLHSRNVFGDIGAQPMDLYSSHQPSSYSADLGGSLAMQRPRGRDDRMADIDGSSQRVATDHAVSESADKKDDKGKADMETEILWETPRAATANRRRQSTLLFRESSDGEVILNTRDTLLDWAEESWFSDEDTRGRARPDSSTTGDLFSVFGESQQSARPSPSEYHPALSPFSLHPHCPDHAGTGEGSRMRAMADSLPPKSTSLYSCSVYSNRSNSSEKRDTTCPYKDHTTDGSRTPTLSDIENMLDLPLGGSIQKTNGPGTSNGSFASRTTLETDYPPQVPPKPLGRTTASPSKPVREEGEWGSLNDSAPPSIPLKFPLRDTSQAKSASRLSAVPRPLFSLFPKSKASVSLPSVHPLHPSRTGLSTSSPQPPKSTPESSTLDGTASSSYTTGGIEKVLDGMRENQEAWDFDDYHHHIGRHGTIHASLPLRLHSEDMDQQRWVPSATLPVRDAKSSDNGAVNSTIKVNGETGLTAKPTGASATKPKKARKPKFVFRFPDATNPYICYDLTSAQVREVLNDSIKHPHSQSVSSKQPKASLRGGAGSSHHLIGANKVLAGERRPGDLARAEAVDRQTGQAKRQYIEDYSVSQRVSQFGDPYEPTVRAPDSTWEFSDAGSLPSRAPSIGTTEGRHIMAQRRRQRGDRPDNETEIEEMRAAMGDNTGTHRALQARAWSSSPVETTVVPPTQATYPLEARPATRSSTAEPLPKKKSKWNAAKKILRATLALPGENDWELKSHSRTHPPPTFSPVAHVPATATSIISRGILDEYSRQPKGRSEVPGLGGSIRQGPWPAQQHQPDMSMQRRQTQAPSVAGTDAGTDAGTIWPEQRLEDFGK